MIFMQTIMHMMVGATIMAMDLAGIAIIHGTTLTIMVGDIHHIMVAIMVAGIALGITVVGATDGTTIGTIIGT